MVKRKESPSEPKGKQILVDEAEFIRTRDALITSWTRLHGAIRDAVGSYIEHSNAVLSGKEAVSHDSLNVINFLSSVPAGAISAAVQEENEEPEKKKRKRNIKPKDPNAPKRPITAYLLYLEDNRPKIQADLGPNQKRGDISAEGTQRWHQLSTDEQQTYKDRYNAAWLKYKEEAEKYAVEHGKNPVFLPDAKATPPFDEIEAASMEKETDSEASESSDDDSESESEEENVMVKEPTPPPVKTPAKRGPKPKKPAVEASAPSSQTPVPASSMSKKTKSNSFTAVNGGKEVSPALKRKQAAAAAAESNKTEEEAKKKRAKKPEIESTPAPEGTPATKEKKKRNRKSAAGEE